MGGIDFSSVVEQFNLGDLEFTFNVALLNK